MFLCPCCIINFLAIVNLHLLIIELYLLIQESGVPTAVLGFNTECQDSPYKCRIFSTDILLYLSQQYKFLLQLPSQFFSIGNSCIFSFSVGNINQWDRVRKLRVHRHWESHAVSPLLFFFWILFQKRKKEKIWELLNFCIWAGDLLFLMFLGKPCQLIRPPKPTRWKEAIWIAESQQKSS